MRKFLVWALLAVGLAWAAPARADDLRPTDLWTTQTKTDTTTTNKTDSVIWTPASGKKIALQGAMISCGGAGKVEIESADVDVLPPIVCESSGFKTVTGGVAPLWMGGTDATLTYTNSGGSAGTQALAILLWGYEYQ